VSESEPIEPVADGWTAAERLCIAALVLALVLLVWLRLESRRPDGSRIPTAPDIVVIHVAGLRSDAVPLSALAADLGFAEEQLLHWPNAFAQSSDSLRSALSLLEGDLVLDLNKPLGEDTLVPRLRRAGYFTALVDDSELLTERVGAVFEVAELARGVGAVPASCGRLWSSKPPQKPAFLMVNLAFAGSPLHGETTDAVQLEARYRARVAEVRGLVAQVSQATSRSSRPQLVVLLGASGLELGEHPEDTESPFDTHLRVPFLVGLRGGQGLPSGLQASLVQSADLAPTLLDFLDLRTRAEQSLDGTVRLGRSLKSSSHAWSSGPVHEVLYLVGAEHVAARSLDWKLICDVEKPWRLNAEKTRLYSVAADPGEHETLRPEGGLGPVGGALFTGLQNWLSRPVAVASSPSEGAP